MLAFDVAEEIEAMLDERVPIVSLFWGDPAPLAARVHDAGALLMMSVGSVAEAVRAVEAGADVIVAQGWEAGGHVRGTTATLALVPAVVDAVPRCRSSPPAASPTDAASPPRSRSAPKPPGSAPASSSAAEADAHPLYRERLLAAGADDTLYSTLFDGGWPDAPAGRCGTRP